MDPKTTAAFSRRDVLKVAAAAPLAALPAVPVSAAPYENVPTNAHKWEPWYVNSINGYLPPNPPPRGSVKTVSGLLEVRAIQKASTPDQIDAAFFWDAHGGAHHWMSILLSKIAANSVNPVLASRAMALLGAAMADATITAWRSKLIHRRANPAQLDRSIRYHSIVNTSVYGYPSEHAAIAWAAVGVLTYLFGAQATYNVNGELLTAQQIADQVGFSRKVLGAAIQPDLDGGKIIGQLVSAKAVQHGQSDGSSSLSWDPVAQPGRPGTDLPYWIPTPPANAFPPLLPRAGEWKTWHVQNGAMVRPALPASWVGPGVTPGFMAEIQEVYNVNQALTQAQLNIAQFWADGGGTVTPPGHWAVELCSHIHNSNFSAPEAARALAYQATAAYDSAVCTWDCKYAYWIARPVTAIRALINANWSSPIGTPPFPTYTSGHSGFSAVSADVLDYFFPGRSILGANGVLLSHQDAAQQAAISRLYGGIHYTSDNNTGMQIGHDLFLHVWQRLTTDGGPSYLLP